MSDLNIRITHRTEVEGRAVERTIDIETLSPPQSLQQVGGTNSTANNQIAAGSAVQQRTLAEKEPPTDAAIYPDFIRLLSDGTRLYADSTRTDHAAVIDTTSGLMWSVESLGDHTDEGDGITQEHCIERCKQSRLLGYDDWRLPTRAELVRLIDDSRHDPAIDPAIFPRVKPRWHWTSTPCAWSSASAWGVDFDNGSVYGYHRSGGGFALAVRRVGQ